MAINIESVLSLAKHTVGSEAMDRICREVGEALRFKANFNKQLGSRDDAARTTEDCWAVLKDKTIGTLGRGTKMTEYLPKSPCEVRPSKIHGFGVFASRDIPAFSYLTLYPCDGIDWWPVMNQPRFHDGFAELTDDMVYRQQLELPEDLGKLSIVGHPELRGDAHFVGHLINDGATCKRVEAAEVYTTASVASSNSLFCPIFQMHFSYKNIKAGEEILSTYGSQYWLDLLPGSQYWVDLSPKEVTASFLNQMD